MAFSGATFALLSYVMWWFVFSEPSVPEPEQVPVIAEEIVLEIEEPEFEPSDLECLALNIYHEARGDSFAGKVAVADVVFNRVENSRFPNNVCDVVKQTVTRVNWKGNVVPVIGQCQFSWFCDGKSDEPFNAEAWQDANMIAENMLRNEWRGLTEGATHYHATYVNPAWVNDRGMQYVGQIGEHKFYRWNR